MVPEIVFRNSLLVLFLVFVAIWLRSFFSTGLSKSSFYTSNEGCISGLSLRTFLSLGIIGILAYLYNPECMQWSYIQVKPFVRLSGIVFGLFGTAFFIWAVKSLGKNFFATLKTRKDHSLITTGAYKFSRHPMYFAFISMWISFSLLSANWFIGTNGLLSYTIIMLGRVPAEEKMLTEKFGDEYTKYRNRTGLLSSRIVKKCDSDLRV
jgi:protein-S-isoprenylcysteine O-methyltransferase Ste14